jgi:hypothetical protein
MELEQLNKTIGLLKEKYRLIDFNFDTECIYVEGDLSQLVKSIVKKTFADKNIKVTEKISVDGKRFVATLSNADETLDIFADANDDFLPDDFFETLESIPVVFKTDKKYFSINPLIGITGQDAWYFCGTEQDLKKARKEGLPLIFPGEDAMQTEEFKKYTEP